MKLQHGAVLDEALRDVANMIYLNNDSTIQDMVAAAVAKEGQRWQNVKTDVASMVCDLTACLSTWTEFEHDVEALQSRLDDTQLALQAPSIPASTISEKRAKLDKYKVGMPT